MLGGAGGEHDEVGFVALELALAFDDDCAHGCPARLGLEPDCLRVRQQLDVRMLESRRTPNTSASDLPWTAHGNPSQFWQRTQAL